MAVRPKLDNLFDVEVKPKIRNREFKSMDSGVLYDIENDYFEQHFASWIKSESIIAELSGDSEKHSVPTGISRSSRLSSIKQTEQSFDNSDMSADENLPDSQYMLVEFDKTENGVKPTGTPQKETTKMELDDAEPIYIKRVPSVIKKNTLHRINLRLQSFASPLIKYETDSLLRRPKEKIYGVQKERYKLFENFENNGYISLVPKREAQETKQEQKEDKLEEVEDPKRQYNGWYNDEFLRNMTTSGHLRDYGVDNLHQKSIQRISAENYEKAPAAKSIPVDGWNGRVPHQQAINNIHHQKQTHSVRQSPVLQLHPQHTHDGPDSMGQHDGKHSLLQFAMLHFRQSPEKFEMLKTADGSISGSLKVIESLKSKKNKSKKGNKENDWTWKEQVDLVKFSSIPIEQSLLRLDGPELNELALECFISVMRYMGDLPMPPDVTEVKCVYTILMHCHKHESLRDEVYCHLMKQTTNNKSSKPDSCQRGWRLFSIIAAYFTCSDILKPYLFKYLETAAYDKRRAYHGTAMVCLHNLRKTFKYGGRKNVPSVEEITAISAGRNSKRQIYRLPGGTERVINTKSTTVVQDVIEEICSVINVQSPHEMEEFSLYCIVEGDTFTMPLAREEYILDVTTELHKNQQVFYLIFCRSVWHFPLRLDSQLYIEVVFNQIAPDYLEGLLLVMPGEQLDQDVIYDIAKIAALLHRAADMQHLPTMKEIKFLLPKPALTVRHVKPAQWVNMVQSNWRDVENLQTIQAKAQVLDILSKWPLFGSSFFAVKRMSDPKERADHILALNRHGVHFIDLVTHETLIHYPFSEVISTRKVKSEDGILYLDMKCGNLMQQRITRLQTDQAHEISRLIRQYITMEQRLRS